MDLIKDLEKQYKKQLLLDYFGYYRANYLHNKLLKCSEFDEAFLKSLFNTYDHFDDYVLSDMKVIKYTGVKMIFEYVMRDKNTNDVMVRAESSHCFTNGKSVISFKREYPEYHKIIDDYVNSNLND